jgi:hypothetical protein
MSCSRVPLGCVSILGKEHLLSSFLYHHASTSLHKARGANKHRGSAKTPSGWLNFRDSLAASASVSHLSPMLPHYCVYKIASMVALTIPPTPHPHHASSWSSLVSSPPRGVSNTLSLFALAVVTDILYFFRSRGGRPITMILVSLVSIILLALFGSSHAINVPGADAKHDYKVAVNHFPLTDLMHKDPYFTGEDRRTMVRQVSAVRTACETYTYFVHPPLQLVHTRRDILLLKRLSKQLHAARNCGHHQRTIHRWRKA